MTRHPQACWNTGLNPLTSVHIDDNWGIRLQKLYPKVTSTKSKWKKVGGKIGGDNDHYHQKFQTYAC